MQDFLQAITPPAAYLHWVIWWYYNFFSYNIGLARQTSPDKGIQYILPYRLHRHRSSRIGCITLSEISRK